MSVVSWCTLEYLIYITRQTIFSIHSLLPLFLFSFFITEELCTVFSVTVLHRTECSANQQCNEVLTKLKTIFIPLSTFKGVTWHYYCRVLISLSLPRSFPPSISHPRSHTFTICLSFCFSVCLSLCPSSLTLFPVVFRGSLVSFSLRVTWFCLSQPEGEKKTGDSGSFFN